MYVTLYSFDVAELAVPSDVTQLMYTNAGFYNPVPPPKSTEASNFPNNGFSSFLGANMPFNIEVC